jgi:hypothetical protein
VSAHVEHARVSEDTDRTPIPRPLEDGSYDVESLGPFVDRLMGDHRVREAAARAIRVLVAEDEPSEEATEAPIEVPPPLPGGSEPITRGDDPPAEKR